jgi:hypothetical protein
MKMQLRFGHALPDYYGHQMVLFEERWSTFLLQSGSLLQPLLCRYDRLRRTLLPLFCHFFLLGPKGVVVILAFCLGLYIGP